MSDNEPNILADMIRRGVIEVCEVLGLDGKPVKAYRLTEPYARRLSPPRPAGYEG